VALLAIFLVGCSPDTQTMPFGDGGSDGGPNVYYPPGQLDGGNGVDYPFVLCHGLDGFKNIGPLTYYYGVADALTKDGHSVYTAVVDPYNSSDVRGAELQSFVEQVLAETGAQKAILICHSQGGLDCRYVASNIPDKIASITTISSPHRGTPIADIAVGDVPGPLQPALDAFLNLLGVVVSGGKLDMDAQAALNLMTLKGSQAFTAAHPDNPNVKYYSIAGRSNGSMGDDTCSTPTEAPFVARWDSYSDPINPLLAATGSILSNNVSPPPTNDGLVPVGSARWGQFLGCIPADHLDEVGQIAGQSPGTGNPFDHIVFYRALADWLKARH
jgi:triacylglycerol lipase